METRKRRKFDLNNSPQPQQEQDAPPSAPAPPYDRVLIRGGKLAFADGHKEDVPGYLARKTNLKISGGLWCWHCDRSIGGHKETGFPCETCVFVRFVPGQYPPGLADQIRVTLIVDGWTNYFAISSSQGEWTVYQVYGISKPVKKDHEI